jgi:hypothetical protein
MLSRNERNGFGLPRCFEQVEARETDGQTEAARAGAARVYIKDAIARMGFGFVGVAVDDDLETGGLRVEVELFEIVEHVDGGACELQGLSERQGFCPGLGVDIAADGVERGDSTELIEDSWIADVAGVEDCVGALESG